jgi:hypothetical protein
MSGLWPCQPAATSTDGYENRSINRRMFNERPVSASPVCQLRATKAQSRKRKMLGFSEDLANRGLGTVVVIGYPGESTHSFAIG